MKILSLTVKNLGTIADAEIKLGQPLNIFYGQVRAGKTTILNAVRWCFGGATPADLIRHGATEAMVRLTFDGGSITREWYRAKDGSITARPVVYIRDGAKIAKPADEIRKLLNPFLVNQDHLRNMSEGERKAFFAELFHLDTKALDTESLAAEIAARDLRAKVKMYGDIDLTPVEVPDVAALREEVADEDRAHREEVAILEAQNRGIREQNQIIGDSCRELSRVDGQVAELLARLKEARGIQLRLTAFLDANKQQPEKAIPSAPDHSAIQDEIGKAAAAEVRAEQYRANLARAKQRDADGIQLLALERRQAEIKKEKAAKLKGIADGCGIKDLAFDDAGSFIFEGTAAGMLSTSQLMRLSSALSSLYPDGFSIELLDRGESLGRSIFEYVKRAQAEELTILATVVGEKPADVPEHVGVFVVTAGKVQSSAASK